MDFLKFTRNKNMLSEVVILDYNQVCSKILSYLYYQKIKFDILLTYLQIYII